MRRHKYNYPGVPEEPGYYVYELWAGLVCLYIGRVGNSGPCSMYNRLGGHRSSKPWWDDVTDIVVSKFESHEEIAAEEPRRIFEMQPVYNRTYAARCKRGHPRPFVEREDRFDRPGCEQCAEEWRNSPERKAWVREYGQRPEVKQRNAERRDFLRESGYWRSDEFKAAREEYKSRPEVRKHLEAYFAAYNRQPRRVASEQAREKGRKGYYAKRESGAARRKYKKRWAWRQSRQPGPGQAGLF